MQSQREFPCSDLQFFNYIARRICRDVQMETGRKIELRQLEEGFQYEKKVQITQRRKIVGRMTVSVLQRPSCIRLEYEMEDGTQTQDYQIRPLQRGCQVLYPERFHTRQISRKLMSAVNEQLRGKTHRRKMEEMMNNWEKEIRQLYSSHF